MGNQQLVETSQLEENQLLAGSQQLGEISQLEENQLLAGNQQLVETSQLEENQRLAGSPQQVKNSQQGRAQLRQIPQHFHPVNVWTRVAALSTTVGANVLISRRTSTGGG